MSRVQNNLTITKQHEIYANESKATRLQRVAQEVYGKYKQDTPLLTRILAHFRPDFHTTVKWICTCLEHVDGFSNTDLLNEVAKNHRSLRLALDKINEKDGPDLKTKAIKFAAEEAEPGQNPVECRYDPYSGVFVAELELEKKHTVGIGINDRWSVNFLKGGLKPFYPFYGRLCNLERLGKLEKPPQVDTLTSARERCIASTKPLEDIMPELAFNHKVTEYNTALLNEQNAVFEALGPLGVTPGNNDWMNPTTVAKLLRKELLMIAGMDEDMEKLKAENGAPKIDDALKGCEVLFEPPARYSTVLYKYAAAGLDVPVPDENSLERLRGAVRAGAQPLVCQENFARTYIKARDAAEHYGAQIKFIRDDILSSNRNAADWSVNAVNDRLALAEKYHERALKVLGDYRHAVQLPLHDDDGIDLDGVKERYSRYGDDSLRRTAPELSEDIVADRVPDLAGRGGSVVAVRQSVPATGQWMAEAMYTPVLVSRVPVPPPSRKETPVPEELPEPRDYSGFADGADVLREMESFYTATGCFGDANQRAQSVPVIPSSIESTIPPRAASSRF